MPRPISVNRILAVANPLVSPPWECGILLGMNDVEKAVAERTLLSEPLTEDGWALAKLHAMRIAWFVVNGWKDSIEIDVGIPSQGYIPVWPVLDGNHRLYAAVIRGDSDIMTGIFGDIDYAAELFSVPADSLLEIEA